MSRTRRASWTLLSSTLFTVVTMFTGLVATPLLLRWLGAERLGTYRAASDAFGFLSLIEFGIGGAAGALLARAHARQDEAATREILAATIRWYLRVAIAMIGVGGLLAAGITHFVPVRELYAADVRVGATVALLSFVLIPLATPFRLSAEARQQGAWVNGLLIMQSLVITGGALVLARSRHGVTGQFAATVIGSVAFQAALVIFGLRRYPGIIAAVRATPDSAIRRELRELNGPAVVLNVCGRLSYFGDSIIVAWFLSPAAVVPLFVTQRLALIFQGQLQSIGNAAWAGLAELHHQGRREQFSQRVVELTGLVAAVASVGGVSIIAFNAQFVRAWVGPTQYGGMAVTLVAVLNAYVLSILSLWGWCLGGTGQIRQLLYPTVPQTAMNVVASVLFTRRFGVVGPILGTLMSSVLVSAWCLPMLLRRLFDVHVGRLVVAAVAPLALAVPYTGMLLLVSRHVTQVGWIALGFQVAAGSVGFLVLWWFTILGTSRRTLLRNHMRVALRGVPA